MQKPAFLLSMLLFMSATAGAAEPILPTMVAIPAGAFSMGAAGGPHDPDYPSSEPVHTVSVKAFRLAKYEVTVGQFRQFVEATGYTPSPDCWRLAKTDWGMDGGPGAWNTPAFAPSQFHPVMCVSWDDAHAYLQWLSQRSGRRFRLPSEAEWEYAARAGGAGRYPFGDDPEALCAHANVLDRTGKAAVEQLTGKARKGLACEDGQALTAVVGLYRPNAWGLHDMLGNVGEIVEDCQHLDYRGAPADGSAWTGDCKEFHGSAMVIHRGGSYSSGAAAASPSERGHTGRDNHSSTGEGFRIAEDLVDGSGSTSAAIHASAFDSALAAAQQAERARMAAGAALNKAVVR